MIDIYLNPDQDLYFTSVDDIVKFIS